ncbi:MAG: efflux RND transporter permease subunit [Prevotellaceae bacterium]|jgi:multidrug efflux pump subunit AcrB|nr:efflux RND transporter permease subunit [Prevotellaceae bacterium]
MVKYLINKPVSVMITFTAFFILGIITYMNIPVSLLPDIAIPEITVQITAENTSARELENTVVSRIRQQLMQTSKLRDIRTETRDGNAVARMNFDYGTNTDLAFIEVNEKVDAAMNYLPKETARPRVIKASATDIPVLNLNLTLKTNSETLKTDELLFIELSEFAESVIRRRIEQLAQVAMVDMSGLVKRQVVIVPDKSLMGTSGITLEDIEAALNDNNVDPGSMLIRDGYYEYNIRFSTILRTIEDIKNIFIRKNDMIFQLKDLAAVDIVPEKEKGMALYNGKRSIVLSIIKQSEENMSNMQTALNHIINEFNKDYPDVEFHISQNQTELLDYTISNLQQNLILAFIFVCLVSLIFLRDGKSPLIIGLSMFVSLIISLLFFYLFKISLNVVSLTGLILALGMMIDNSIIVTDNVGQYKDKGLTLDEACVKGTNEVIAPMLSSSFTTISVFVPLIFLSGIAGAIFFDQAFSVTVGLLVSYITGIMLLPVLYKLAYSMKLPRIFGGKKKAGEGGNPAKVSAVEKLYHRIIEWIFRHKALTAAAMFAIFPLCAYLFTVIPKEKMPNVNQDELIAAIEWNENIHVIENNDRTVGLLNAFLPEVKEISALVAQQQFLLNIQREQTSAETEVYIKAKTPDDIPKLKTMIEQYLKSRYPQVLVTFSPAGTIFEKIFDTGESDLIVEYYSRNKAKAMDAGAIHSIEKELTEQTGETPTGISFQNQLNLSISREKLLLYKIPYNAVYKALKTAFKENQFATLRSYQQYLPIIMGEDERTVNEIINNTFITAPDNIDKSRNKLPLSSFVTVTSSEDLKTIISGKAGEYIPFEFPTVNDPERMIRTVKEHASKNPDIEVGFSGSFFSNKSMLNELMVILFISILLMYFILVAQFENFVQPLIVLLEIPIDVTAALALLIVLGHSLNLMSAIGIVVTCGIIINDSILKVDIMNQLRKSGLSLMEAIHEAGKRRLKAILMTSMTSIVCMAPLLFSGDLGSELEKPLAIATIGGMLIGTPVSLFVVPLAYWWIYRKQEHIT